MTLIWILCILCFIALFLGLVRPDSVIRWGKRRGRGMVLLIYGVGFIVFLFAGLVTTFSTPGRDKAIIMKGLGASNDTSIPTYTTKTVSETNDVWTVNAQTSVPITESQAKRIAAEVIDVGWQSYSGVIVTVVYDKKSTVKVNGKEEAVVVPVNAYSWKAARTKQGVEAEGYTGSTVPFFKEMNR